MEAVRLSPLVEEVCHLIRPLVRDQVGHEGQPGPVCYRRGLVGLGIPGNSMQSFCSMLFRHVQ